MLIVTSYLSPVVNTRRIGILTMLLRFLWLEVRKSDDVCLCAASQRNTGMPIKKSELNHLNYLNNSPVCLLILWFVVRQHQEPPAQQFSCIFHCSISTFCSLFPKANNSQIISTVDTKNKTQNINYVTTTPSTPYPLPKWIAQTIKHPLFGTSLIILKGKQRTTLTTDFGLIILIRSFGQIMPNSHFHFKFISIIIASPEHIHATILPHRKV